MFLVYCLRTFVYILGATLHFLTLWKLLKQYCYIWFVLSLFKWWCWCFSAFFPFFVLYTFFLIGIWICSSHQMREFIWECLAEHALWKTQVHVLKNNSLLYKLHLLVGNRILSFGGGVINSLLTLSTPVVFSFFSSANLGIS